MAPKFAVAKAKAVALLRAKAKAKAAPKAKAAMRVRDGHVPRILELLKDYGWLTAAQARNGRTIRTIAAFLFQCCDEDETGKWVKPLWYKTPVRVMCAIKQQWGAYMQVCLDSTRRGVGRHPHAPAWAVSARGAVMGNI